MRLSCVCANLQFEMERRSWPWKKKSSGKAGADKEILASDSAGVLAGSLGDQVTDYALIPSFCF